MTPIAAFILGAILGLIIGFIAGIIWLLGSKTFPDWLDQDRSGLLS